MPHKAKAEEAIKRRMTEIQDIIETCNLAPYKMDEYKKELKKLNEMLGKHRGRNGFTTVEVMIVVGILAIILVIVSGAVLRQKTDIERQKEVIAMTGELERIEYLSGVNNYFKTALHWKNGTTSVVDGHVENPVPKGVRAKVVWDKDSGKYSIVPDGPFPAEMPR